jgi:hypothetical protein
MTTITLINLASKCRYSDYLFFNSFKYSLNINQICVRFNGLMYEEGLHYRKQINLGKGLLKRPWGWALCLKPITPVTQEVQIKRISVQGWPRQKVSKTLI